MHGCRHHRGKKPGHGLCPRPLLWPKALNEVVVIGYGVAKKSDLTGSVTAIKPDSKNKGVVVNAQDLLCILYTSSGT